MVQAKAGDIATALEIAQPIDEPLYRAEALRDIATVQAKTGNGQAAKRTFSAAFRAARVIRAAIFRVESLCEIATAQMEAGHGQEANQTFASALKAAHAHAIDEPDYSAIVSNDIMEFITAQAKAGDIAAAVRNAHSVEGAGFGSRALVEIAAMQAEERDFKHAMTIALHIKIALVQIARQIKCGQWMSTKYRGIPGTVVRLHSLCPHFRGVALVLTGSRAAAVSKARARDIAEGRLFLGSSRPPTPT